MGSREQIDTWANRLHRTTRQEPVKAGRKPLTARERLGGGWSGQHDDPSRPASTFRAPENAAERAAAARAATEDGRPEDAPYLRICTRCGDVGDPRDPQVVAFHEAEPIA